ncbi:MAG: M48 family metalloprotease [Bacteroidota bacterium]
MKAVTVSDNFKKQTTRAILAVVFFLLTYLLLLGLALLLTVCCVYWGGSLILQHFSVGALIVGLPLISFGGMILLFLLKFLFKTTKVDRSHLLELRRSDAPQLFQLVETLAREVDTPFPKRIYLSTAVNASVFYDSSFWSMFVSTPKNLEIGLGLVNSLSAAEFKAVLAHEFGHFSQKSMRVGSYVYHVNLVIFNLLHDDEWYENVLRNWAEVGGFFAFAVLGAVRIIQGFQWILAKVYAVVNLSYLRLSREMEFHADAVAASVTGRGPLQTALLRLGLAESAYQHVLHFYEGQIAKATTSANIFPEQRFVMHYLAQQEDLRLVDDLPQVRLRDLNRYNKSKLVIKDQWASHPSTPDRIEALEKLGLPDREHPPLAANSLFADLEHLQQRLTRQLFATVQYADQPRVNSQEVFARDFVVHYQLNSFDPLYEGYYDQRNPQGFDLEEETDQAAGRSFASLYAPEQVDRVYQCSALKNDLEVMEAIQKRQIPIKTFDYDGRKYTRFEAAALCRKLRTTYDALQKDLNENDRLVFHHFYTLAKAQGRTEELLGQYRTFFASDQEFARAEQLAPQLQERLQFIQEETPFGVIESNFAGLRPLEERFKQGLERALADNRALGDEYVTGEDREQLAAYLHQNWCYFSGRVYKDDNLARLFLALRYFPELLNRNYFLRKRQLLQLQIDLERATGGGHQKC